MRTALLVLILAFVAGCASSGAGSLIDDVEYTVDDDYFNAADAVDEGGGAEGYGAEAPGSNGFSLGSTLDDHYRSCLSGWAFTGRALSRRITMDSERLFGK